MEKKKWECFGETETSCHSDESDLSPPFKQVGEGANYDGVTSMS